MKLDEKNKSIRITISGITATLYIVLGYLFQPISFLGIQFRVAELMVGMCLLFPISGLIGNVLGVFIVNLVSPLGLLDWVLSPLMNIPALLMIIIVREKKYLVYLGGVLYAIIISFDVALILWLILNLPFWLMFIQVLISEIVLASLGILLFKIIGGRLDIQLGKAQIEE